MKADDKTKAEVLDVVNRMTKAYAARDMDGTLSFFVSDPATVVIGTGVDEKRVGPAEIKDAIKRDFSQSESVSMTLANSIVSSLGQVAWLTADMDLEVLAGGKKIDMSARLTGVLVKSGDRWLIVQMHLSMPFAEQAPGESFPAGH